jgi:hypothetical protein
MRVAVKAFARLSLHPHPFVCRQALDHTDALQLLQNEIGALARDPSYNLRIVAAVAAHSAASAGLLQFFKDHCLSFLLVLKSDKVCCAVLQCLVAQRARDDAECRCATCGCERLGYLHCLCAWASLGAVWLGCSPVSRI